MDAFLFAVFSLLAAIGLIVGCGVFVAWLKGDFLPQDEPEYQPTYHHSPIYEPEIGEYEDLRLEARREALVRIEERELLRELNPDPEPETPVEATVAPVEAPEPPSEPPARPVDHDREAARAEALARIAARAAVEQLGQHEAEVQHEAEEKLRIEIEKRAAKVEKSKPRPGVRTIDQYDFDKPLRDDLPRSGMQVDPLDQLPGYR